MSRAEAEIVIDAPVERVWPLVGDPARWPEWQHVLQRAELLAPDRFRVVGGNDRRSYAYEIVIDTLDAPQRIAWRYAERIKGSGDYTLEARDGATLVRTVETLQIAMLPGIRWVVERLMFNRQFRKTVQGALETLKERVEGTGS